MRFVAVRFVCSLRNHQPRQRTCMTAEVRQHGPVRNKLILQALFLQACWDFYVRHVVAKKHFPEIGLPKRYVFKQALLVQELAAVCVEFRFTFGTKVVQEIFSLEHVYN